MLKKTLLFLFLYNFIFSAEVYSQNINSSKLKKIEFTSFNGYNISNPISSIYDDKGWLWILGENKLTSEFVIGDREIILQRFDGNNFFTLQIPYKFKNKITRGGLFKNKKGGLYLKLWFNHNSKAQLFFIDVETLHIEKVLAYDNFIKNRHTDHYYYLEDTTRIIVTHEEKLFSAELDGLKIKMIDSIKYDKPNKSLFIQSIKTFGDNIIAKLESEDFFLLDGTGKFIKRLTKNDFIDAKGNPFLPKYLNNNFTLNGEHYFYFDASHNQFKYNQHIKKFEEQTNLKKLHNSLYVNPAAQDKDKIAIQTKNNIGYTINLYDIVDNSYQIYDQINVDKFPVITFRDLGKDLAVLSENKLELYFFENTKIKTFLKGKSIRAINQLSSNRFIVSTDSEGFYEVDVESGIEKEIEFKNQNNTQIILYPRDIILKDSLIITNDIGNIFISDKNYTILSVNNTGHPSVEMIQVEDTIFKGGDNRRIFKFSIKDKVYTEVKNSDEIIVKEFATDGKKVFATTTKGIFKYEKGNFTMYEFDTVKTEDFLSIKYTQNYGVLVTTKFGEIYQFDDTNNTLELFYQDALKASVVGIVVDNEKKLWLNTYAGIVSYNPSNKEVKRYTKKDGVYELEGNRYSTFKDKKGNIFIGSFKGVSFFNPKELEENTLHLKPIISSVSSFNVQSKKWTTTVSPSEILDMKKLTLPASNQRFSARVSVLGIVNPNDIKYRYKLLDTKNKQDWIRLYNGNEIVFSNLAAGEYTLQVEALTLANQKIGNTLELKIVSRLIFYKTWWFALALLIVFLSIISYIAYQFKQKQKLYASNKIAINEAKIKEVMMLEIHHRIKNNLQVVSGLLGLQALNSTNKEVKSKLKDSQGRIESIAGIHNILYNTNNKEFITVKDYFNDIISYNKTLFPVNISYSLTIDPIKMLMDKAIPLALILNELINNSYKHAFKKQKNPEISITFKEYKTNYVFTYLDNGNFKKKNKKVVSMGMKIVTMMIEQLKGKSEIKEEENFQLKVTFPKEKQ